MTDFITEFSDKMRVHGFEPKGAIVADDKWHPAYCEGDNKNYPTGTYSLRVDATEAVGCFFSRKEPENKIGYNSKSGEKHSPEELKRIKREQAAKQKAKDEEEERRYHRLAIRLDRVYKNLPDAPADHPYLKKKKITPEGIKWRKKNNELILPFRQVDGIVYTIQKITTQGNKYLFAGGKKKGSYLALATRKEDLSIFLVGEGYATARSMRLATEMPTICAIDSGNIKPVLIALKKKYPNSKFIIGADNDAYTKNAKGEPWNVGKEKADQAATSAGGAYVVMPDIVNDKNTDYNDVYEHNGLDAVRASIMPIVERVRSNKAEAVIAREEDNSSIQHPGDDFAPDYDAIYNNAEENTDLRQGDFGMNFKVLGYDSGQYYYFPFGERQIVALTPSAHTLPNLFRLDDLDAWFEKFGADGNANERKMVTYATNGLMSLAKSRGIFKEEDRVRGCGAWIDNGRKILHCGNVLYVDGVETKFDQLESEFTYIAAAKLMKPAINPLSNKEAYALRTICEAVTWENKLSGSLLAGWLVIAPVCGALDFRPHIYLTGEAESGKSTVFNKIIKKVLGRMSLSLDGGTTEPSVREQMGYDARPLVYDEAEKDKNNTMISVIELARKASSGSVIKKFGQRPFNARFCACFSAVNPPVNKTVDESRMSFLHIKKNRKPSAIEDYDKLLEMIEETIKPDYSARMITRTLENLDTLFENIKTFKRAARKVIRGARASEVIGTMLAGLYLLGSTNLIDLETAAKWIAEHDWTNHTIIDEDTDPVRLLQYLSSSLLRYTPQGAAPREVTIGELIVMAAGYDEAADDLLRRYGIAVKNGLVHIASRSQHLEKLLRETDWSMKWTRMLSNIEGAEAFKIFYFGVGNKTSGVSLPIKLFTDKEPVKKEEQPTLDLSDDFNDQEIPF